MQNVLGQFLANFEVLVRANVERGIDLMNTAYNFLDLTAKGRDENPKHAQDWVRYLDDYKGRSKDCCA
jgi:predicted dithiol-disulfide oxidoreductase (DUF899 family)